MQSKVLIKSFPNGITVFLDDSIEFSELVEEVGKKFRESASFFKDAKMALSFEGRKLSAEEEKLLVSQITANCKLNIICLVGKNEEKNQVYLKAIHQVEKKEEDENEGRFFRETLRDGQSLELDSSIVIIGDVYPGCSVISKKDIIVVGGLYGEAVAGTDGRPGHFVVALEMSPEKLRIGALNYDTSKKPGKWSIKPKMQPKIAFEKGGMIVTESITKELLNMLPVEK